jgi:catalase
MTAPKDNLSEKLVDGLNSVFGAHPGSRAAHAKGICCTGTFVATPDAATLTRAAHMSGRAVPVIVRFSNASGDPTTPDIMGGGAGMAVKFRLGDSESTDLLSIAIPIFPSRTPEDFLQLTQALTPDPTTHLPDKRKIDAFAAAHPELQRALQLALMGRPLASFAQTIYHAVHAFRFANASGDERYIRYSWRPEPGTARIYLDQEQHIPPDYLQQELRERFATGPVRFTLHLQLAEKGDDVTDPAKAWPEERRSVPAGTLELTGLVSDQDGGCEALVFDPSRVTDGIVPSDDPILKARPGAYSVSFHRRTSS